MAQNLLQGGGVLKLSTSTTALPTIQNLKVPDSLRMTVQSPNAPVYSNLSIKRTSAFGIRLSNNLPNINRDMETSKEALILAWRPFKYWNGSSWDTVRAKIWMDGRWVGLPWHAYKNDRWNQS